MLEGHPQRANTIIAGGNKGMSNMCVSRLTRRNEGELFDSIPFDEVAIIVEDHRIIQCPKGYLMSHVHHIYSEDS